MDNNVIGPIRAWLRTFDVEGRGVARREDLEPELTKLLGFNNKDMNKLLRRFQSGADNIDYDALLAFVFDVRLASRDGRAFSPKRKGKETRVMASTAPDFFFKASDEQRAETRSVELAWLRNLSGILPDRIRQVIVSHRGFHCTDDRTKRPVENTLPAYEQAWSSGILNCECDVQLTSDGHLVLTQDENMLRLALMMQSNQTLHVDRTLGETTKRTAPSSSLLTLKQLTSMTTKSGMRQPLLKDVLDCAATFESARLVIEVRPGGKNIAGVLADFFIANPFYLKHVAVVMSFDPDVLFKFAEELPQVLRTRPKVLLLTTKKSAPGVFVQPYEQLLDFDKGDVRADAERLITRGRVRLDGVYVEWSEKLLGRAAQHVQKLCEMCTVGMWQNKGEPDSLGVAVELARLGVSFVNTDFPRGFLREHVGKAQPEDRLPDSLFASVVAAPDGNAGGVWKERPTRQDFIKALQEREFDILIIGGGATGLGTALEATRQGYSVALVERGDFACGTSSKSSNMIHGGIRYLQAFVKDPDNAAEQIDVVKKGLAEQTYMYNCAPYNVRPCPFMVACYEETERDIYGKLLKKYDELGVDDPFPESNWNTKKETLFRFPHLRQKGLVGSFIYYDGQQDDARMATLIGLTAIEGGAVISNYLEVESLITENGITKGAIITDSDAADGRIFKVRAKVVVNATGPFTDAILKMDQGPSTPNIIKPAAGTHVVLPDHFSPDRTGLAILETSDGRAMFYLPWMGQTIVGTTDHLSEIKPDLTPPTSDIEWIIKEVNRYLNPDHTPASQKDVLAAWVGIRPLAQGLQSATGTKDTEAEEEIVDIPDNEETNTVATKLQAIQRGKNARKEVDAKRSADAEAAAAAQAMADAAAEIPDDEETNKAAAKLQAIRRGKNARKEVEILKEEADAKRSADAAAQALADAAAEIPDDEETNKAAAKLQAIRRGKNARKEVETMKEASRSGCGNDTKSVPREHAVIVSKSSLVTITGGKWTSYRHMAEDTLKEAVAVGKLKPLKKQCQAGCPTFEQGFVGTKAGPNVDYVKLDLACTAPFHSDVVELRRKWHFSRDIAENLVASYGTHAIEVACIARRGEKQGFAERLAKGYPWIMAQVVYGVRREYARTVPDVLSRRTRLAQVDVLAAYDAIPKIVDVMAEELDWSQERIQTEVDNAGVFLESCGLEFCRKQQMRL